MISQRLLGSGRTTARGLSAREAVFIGVINHDKLKKWQFEDDEHKNLACSAQGVGRGTDFPGGVGTASSPQRQKTHSGEQSSFGRLRRHEKLLCLSVTCGKVKSCPCCLKDLWA